MNVVIVGGGIVGYATALHLLREDPQLTVAIIEADPSYRLSASGKGTGGVRQLFTRPENIALSQYTLDVIENWEHYTGHDAAGLGWRPNGYLFVAGEQDADALARNYETQRHHDVAAQWMEPADIAAAYPQLNASDLSAAVLSPCDGWLDPQAFFAGVQAKALELGAVRLVDRVVDFDVTESAVRQVRMESGEVLRPEAVVNAAGTWAPQLADRVGMRLPVEPMRRHEHYVETGTDPNQLPFVKDVDGLAVHAHRAGLSVGLVDFEHPGGADFTIDEEYYPRVVEPALRWRLPGAGQLRLRRTWTGLYDQNRFDGNMIIGNWPGELDNFYVASGFSGHGFMHALGVGRGLAELIVHGQYRSLDLSRMGYQRVLDDQPYPELGIR